MEETNLLFNNKATYAKEFEAKYAKSIDLPTTKCLNAFFHPTLRDHIITVNEICFPLVESTNVKGLFHNKISDEFEDKISQHYMDAAGKFQARRRFKIATNPELQLESASSDYVPFEPSSSIFSDSSYYEGGVEESMRMKLNMNKLNIKRTKTRIKKEKDKPNRQAINKDNKTIKGTYPRVKSRLAEKRDFIKKTENQQVFNKAVDMFMEDKNVYFQYKDFDPAMEPEVNDQTPDLYEYDGVNYKVDDYWPDRPSILATPMSFDYSPIPKYKGMDYVPPPFREKYEICIWRVNPHGVCKIKSSYFTPEIAEFESDDFGGFEFNMALDHQTMILIENVSKNNEVKKDKLTILIFDIYSLDKITEFQVDIVDSEYQRLSGYEEKNDLVTPQFSTFSATDENFPRIVTWNDGNYVLSCIGAQMDSKVYHEFKVYSTDTTQEIAHVRREDHDVLSGLMIDVFHNPKNNDTLIFLMKEDIDYSLIEVNFFKDKIKEVCTYTCSRIKYIKLAEDLSQVFIVTNNKDNTEALLYCERYGTNVDFEKHDPIPDTVLGNFVKYSQVVGNYILIDYDTEEGFKKIGLFKSGKQHVYDDPFEIDQAIGYSVLEDTNEIVCLHGFGHNGCKVTIIDDRSLELEDSTFDISEFSIYKFSFPLLAMIKGGSELIKYNFYTKTYTY